MSLDLGNGPTSARDMLSLRDEIVDALRTAGFKGFDTGSGLGGCDIWFDDGKEEYFMTVMHSRTLPKK